MVDRVPEKCDEQHQLLVCKHYSFYTHLSLKLIVIEKRAGLYALGMEYQQILNQVIH